VGAEDLVEFLDGHSQGIGQGRAQRSLRPALAALPSIDGLFADPEVARQFHGVPHSRPQPCVAQLRADMGAVLLVRSRRHG